MNHHAPHPADQRRADRGWSAAAPAVRRSRSRLDRFSRLLGRAADRLPLSAGGWTRLSFSMAAVDPTEDEAPPPRSARLALVTPAGVVVGSLPAVPVSTPWWPDVEPVVRATRERRGVVVTVLRLLEAERSQPHGGEVAYLAETPEPVDAEPWRGRLRPHRLRQRYAEPGGPAADLAWAKSSLLQVGLVPLGPAAQVRTWNLSSIWRIPTESETVWLKSVPPFFAHEGRLMSALARECVPAVLGFDAARMLLREAPGDDLHHADPSQLTDMVELLLGIQLDWRDRLGLLLSFGLPDWRGRR